MSVEVNDNNVLEVTFRPFQMEIFEDDSRFKVAVVHRRAGKTFLGLMMMMIGCQEKKRRFWYIAPTYRQAKMIAWKQLMDMIPVQARVNEVELSVTLPNGSLIELKGADNPDSLRGAGLHGVVMDEFSEMDSRTWPEIVRPMLSDTNGWALFIGTPKGKNHFYEMYQKAKRLKGWNSWLAKASDTKILDESELQSLQVEMTPEQFQQEYECSFLTFAGLVYKEFDPAYHVIKPISFRPRTDWARYIGVDFGYRDPTAVVWIAVSPEKDFYVYDEWYETEKTLEEVKEAILNKTGQDKIRGIICDSARPDHIEQFRRWQLPAQESKKGKDSIVDGINDVRQLMKVDPVKKLPKLFILEPCENVQRELKLYAYEETADGKPNKEKPVDMFNHALDAIRYVIHTTEQENITPNRYVDPYVREHGTAYRGR